MKLLSSSTNTPPPMHLELTQSELKQILLSIGGITVDVAARLEIDFDKNCDVFENLDALYHEFYGESYE